jgi:hypothetical protein
MENMLTKLSLLAVVRSLIAVPIEAESPSPVDGCGAVEKAFVFELG